MTQEELLEKLEEIDWNKVSPSDGRDKILELINQHTLEVIGEDEEYDGVTPQYIQTDRNDLRAWQREKAALK